MYCFALLVNSHSLSEFLDVLKKCTIVFSSQRKNKDVEESFHSLLASFINLGNRVPDESSCDFEDVELDTNVTNDLSEEEQIMRQCNAPFLATLEVHLSTLPLNCQQDDPPNELHQPNWILMMKKKWLSMVPFWTCILRGKLY